VSASPLDIHFIAIGGTGMAPLACLLKQLGHEVRGSDAPLYPPMSDLLADHGIEPMVGFDPDHLEPAPDLVIVGNAIPRQNPEAAAAEERDLPRLSMPQALSRFFLAERKPLVLAGTHGKTTTTSMAAWVYSDCGTDPGYLVGGVPLNLPSSFRIGTGERFIVEGDEYNAAYFDRGPKFLHYRPETIVLTSVEYDHTDLYPDPESILAAYRKLIGIVPPDGRVIACGDSAEVRRLASEARCPVTFYGLGDENELRPLGPIEADSHGSRFRLPDPEGGEVEIYLPVPGAHNVSNALSVWAAATGDGLPAAKVAGSLSRFRGVKRRLEVLGSAEGITVVDDFAHHPTAVRESLRALRQRHPGARLVSLYEPRSLSAGRRIFREGYEEAFSVADVVILAPVFHAARLSDDERIDLDDLVARLERRGVEAKACADVEGVFESYLETARHGDVVVTMSSGAFGGMPYRIRAALVDHMASARMP
jgi:UDP-N-acetylmuramate: L-alanyl-gamma-D-glutamyl-meso-diaminopimelate ligase